MRDVQTRVKRGGKAAAALATDVGKKAAKKVALAADTMFVKLGEAAKKRQRARKAKSALKTAGKVALVVGAGVATAFAGKSMLARANGRGKKRR
jgi:thiamine pyrophosphate-dependent acetolactate synthase large subunit-like protein